MAERQPRRRQQAEHDGDAAQDLRHQHLVEVGLAGLEGTPAEAQRKQRETAGHQQAAVDATFELDGDRRGQQLGEAGHQHDGADFQGPVLAHEAQEHRHQIDRAVEADAEGEAQQAADGEVAVEQRPEFDHRMAAAEAAAHEAGAADEADREQAQHMQ